MGFFMFTDITSSVTMDIILVSIFREKKLTWTGNQTLSFLNSRQVFRPLHQSDLSTKTG